MWKEVKKFYFLLLRSVFKRMYILESSECTTLKVAENDTELLSNSQVLELPSYTIISVV